MPAAMRDVHGMIRHIRSPYLSNNFLLQLYHNNAKARLQHIPLLSCADNTLVLLRTSQMGREQQHPSQQ
jgi:hypothetical protein